MAFNEKKYRQAIADLADQICEMVKDDDDEDSNHNKEDIWDECSNYMADASQKLDEELELAYVRTFKNNS